MSWLDFALNPLPDLFAAPPGGVSVKVKDALLRKRLTDRQIGVAYDYLTRTDHDVMGGMLGLATLRRTGQHRRARRDGLGAARLDSRHRLHRRLAGPAGRGEEPGVGARVLPRLFAETGGVPVPGERYDGTFINHPDTDLADPELNTSGVPWSTLYYRRNYRAFSGSKIDTTR